MANNWFTENCYRKQYTINRARGVYYNSKTYVVYQGPDSDPRIMAFDHASDSWSQDYLVGESIISNNDDHGNPGMCIDASGRIHVVYGGHGTQSGEMRHRVSVNPEDITSWQNGGNLPEPKSTYPGFFTLDNGNLILIYRGRNPSGTIGSFNQHKASWYSTFSTDNGNTWSLPVAFLQGTEAQDPDYAWYAYGHAQGNELNVAFCYHQCADDPNHLPIRRNAYYIKRRSDGSWVDAAENTLTLPITRSDADDTANNKIKVYDSGGNNTQYPSVDVDSSNIPFIAFGEEETGGVRKYCGNWTGSSWNVQSISYHGNNSQTRTVILYRGSNDFSLFCFGTSGQDLLEYKTTDGNSTWEFVKTIWSGVWDDPCILWHPHDDAYLFFDDGAALTRRGYLYGDSGFVGTNGITEGIVYECENLSQTASDNTSIIDDSSASNGQWLKLASNESGDWITFTLNVTAGTYNVVLRGKTWSGRGNFQLSIDGINQGSVIEQYDSSDSFQEWNLGSKSFSSSGNFPFRFECVGKSASASDFTGSFDFIRLESQSLVYECENLSQTASDNASIITDSSASNGQWIKLASNESGDWITFTLNVPAGTYNVVLRGKTWSGRGNFQLSIDGINQGSFIEQYDSSASFREWNLGSKSFNSSGNYTFRFECIGKSASSSGFTGSFDFIRLE